MSLVAHVQAGEQQFGLEHLKLFNDINYLYYDAYTSTSTLDKFYVFLADGRLHSFTFDGQSFQSKLVEGEFKHYLASGDSADRYPCTLSFANEKFAFISNGTGILSMYYTGEQRSDCRWTEVLSLEVEVSGEKTGPFIIMESRCYGEDRIEVLLRNITSQKNSVPNESNRLFWNKLNWISFKNVFIAFNSSIKFGITGSGTWRVDKVNEVVCKGHLDMATFDFSGEEIIVIGNENTAFSPNSGTDSVKMELETPDTSLKIGQEQTVDSEKKDAAYIWSQTSEDVTVLFKFPEKIVKDDISLTLDATSIHLVHKGSDLLNGKLGGVVDISSSTFTTDGGKLELTLFKNELCGWTEIVIGDERGVMECDRDAMNAAYAHLEQFTSDFSGLEASDASMVFNSGQLEECDMNGDDISKILWISRKTHAVKHTSDISGNPVLFTLSVPREPRMFCIRMDVDGILWSFSNQDNEPVFHKATFNALGYVQASKSQKKFSTCSPDFVYSAIVEDKRRAFIYWQSTPLDSDLRNRHTGRRVAGLSKQYLISVSNRGDFGEVEAIPDNIVGVYAGKNIFFLLTTCQLFAVTFN
ncbi:unnamed protein product [Enterobius vermicularis]|uniref:NudC domain-containing protein 1 n=1 Tax=Enterobius vermicularis TaxID=51028 RepID=A0A3P6I728_ENTVE|nr:unnamed protein product [Enterobius vermicularis]